MNLNFTLVLQILSFLVLLGVLTKLLYAPLVKYLDDLSEADIVGLNIPTGVPLVYELDDSLRPVGSRYLGDADEVEKAMQSVANQGKSG